jgi:hypothetical protein
MDRASGGSHGQNEYADDQEIEGLARSEEKASLDTAVAELDKGMGFDPTRVA